MSKRTPSRIGSEKLSKQIYLVRGQRVMLDSDLAALYGVTVSALNQAVSRNVDRFPSDFSYRLTLQELSDLKSQIVISSSETIGSKGLTETPSSEDEVKASHGGRRKLPLVFTEHGVAMLSSVLRSPRAVQVNIEIIRAFVRLRRLLATPGELVEQLQQLAKTVDLHDGQIRAITQVLQQMMAPQTAAEEKRRIGFQTASADSNVKG